MSGAGDEEEPRYTFHEMESGREIASALYGQRCQAWPGGTARWWSD